MGFRKVKKQDSFAQWFIDNFGKDKFNTLINHKKNIELGLDIWSISKRSEAHIWFFCEHKDYHEFSLSADKYNIGNRCKYCARTKYVHPKDSIGQYIVDNYGNWFINTIWSENNKKSPFKYPIGTEQKAWFKCDEGIHEDKLRYIRNAKRSNFKCPYCVEIGHVSKLQEKVYKYICSLGYCVNTEYKCTLIPKNPKTQHNLPYDNEIVELNLIIETHGRQHYELISKYSRWIRNKTPEDYLHNRKVKDRYKRMIAIKNGYYFLEIPYWSDDNTESWKILINETINNIKREQRLRRINYINDVDATV